MEESGAVKELTFFKADECKFGCEGKILVADTIFHVCKERLVKDSGFFRAIFLTDFKEKNGDVTPLEEETPEDVALFFRTIEGGEESKIFECDVAVLVRLADKFICADLQQVLINFIRDREETVCPERAVEWLSAVETASMPKETINICAAAAACLPLNVIKEYRTFLSSNMNLKIVDVKLGVLYNTAGSVDYERRSVQGPITQICDRHQPSRGSWFTVNNCPVHRWSMKQQCCTRDTHQLKCCIGPAHITYKCRGCNEICSLSPTESDCECHRARYKWLFDAMT